FLGHPHTEALRTTERYRRLDFGRMELLLTFEDPTAYSKPWTLKIDTNLAADTEMLEYVCNENEKDRVHMVSKASDYQRNATELAPEILAKYAGNYQVDRQVTGVVLEQGQLKLSFGGTLVPLIPSSETTFFSPLVGRVVFQKDAEGAINRFTLDGVGAFDRR